MNVPESIVAAQLADLLERLEHYRAQRSASELASARERAQTILTAARGEARTRMRTAVAYERTRLAEALQRRRAAHDAEGRRQQHVDLRELVQRALEALPGQLIRRWSDPPARQAWCEAALLAAGARLRANDWTLEIASGAPHAERAALLARAGELRAGEHTLRERAELRAGMRVLAAGAELDATCAGLLDDPSATGARILREWLREAP